MRSRYIYRGSELVYAQEGDRVVLNNLPEATDPGYMVMGDIQPYRSMVDGSIINSRSSHRAHLKQHGCVEVGNDSSLYAKPKPISSPPGLKEDIIRAVNDIERRRR